MKWAGPWENVSYVICEQQRRRSACASVQSNQRLCFSLLRYYSISRFYSRNFKTLASFCGCAGRFVSGLVGNSRRHVFSWPGSNVYHLFAIFTLYFKYFSINNIQFINNQNYSEYKAEHLTAPLLANIKLTLETEMFFTCKLTCGAVTQNLRSNVCEVVNRGRMVKSPVGFTQKM